MRISKDEPERRTLVIPKAPQAEPLKTAPAIAPANDPAPDQKPETQPEPLRRVA